MSMKRPPLVMWHCAVDDVHRQVAVASFLRAAQAAQSAVYYHDTDPTAPLVLAVAQGLQMPLHAVTRDPLSGVLTFPHASVWIGSHEGNEPPWCTELRTLVEPPQVILCLDDFSPHTPPDAPPGHQFFVTGTLFRAIAGHGAPSRNQL